MGIIYPLAPPGVFDDTHIKQDHRTENEECKIIAEYLPPMYYSGDSENSEEVNKPQPLEIDIMQVQNELSPKSESKEKLLMDESPRLAREKVLTKLMGIIGFLINKIVVPFGEYILMNPTVWIILKSTVEIFLELILYIILAICYVFLKFISQEENKAKVSPQKNEDSRLNIGPT